MGKASYLAFGLLTISLLVSTITLGVLYGKEKDNTQNNPKDSELCQTPECIKAANRILSSMDQAVDPCDDFYEFSCSKWVDEHIISETQSSVSVFNDVRDLVSKSLKTVLEKESSIDENDSIKKARNYYASCMDTKKIDELGLEPIRQLIKQMGGWPILGDSFSPVPLDKTLAEFSSVYGVGAVIGSYVYSDSKNSSLNIFTITEPSFGLPSRDYYLDEKTSEETIPAYKDYIRNFINVMDQSVDATTLADKIVDFETDLASITLSSAESRDEAAIYNKYRLGEMRSEVNNDFDWLKYVQNVMSVTNDFNDGVIDINEDTEVIMYAKKYGGNFTSTILDYTSDDSSFLQNYLVWRVMKSRSSYMPKILRDARASYNEKVSGTTAEEARWLTCADISESFFPMPVGSLFVESYFSEENKKATENMVENVRESFLKNLDDIDWMDSETKAKAVEKANLIRKMIAYPDYIVNNKEKMDLSYKGTEIEITEYFSNSQNLQLLSNKWSLSKLDDPVDKDEWISGPAIVNAFYSPSRNQIFFPAGILQPPFYDQYQPTAMNYGGIGMVIGHEITHGFDNSGSNYDGYGNLIDWWSKDSRSGFDKEAAKMAQQYSSFYWDAAGDNLDGNLTLGENIADNGGIRESFLAFQKWKKENPGIKDIKLPGLQNFSEEQLFFLGFSQVWCGKYTKARAVQLLKTDPHSPGEFRVKIPGLNYEEFGKAYKCTQGEDKMYPEAKDTTRVW